MEGKRKKDVENTPGMFKAINYIPDTTRLQDAW